MFKNTFKSYSENDKSICKDCAWMLSKVHASNVHKKHVNVGVRQDTKNKSK